MKKQFKFYYEKNNMIKFLDKQIAIMENQEYSETLISGLSNVVNNVVNKFDEYKSQIDKTVGGAKRGATNVKTAFKSGNREWFFLDTIDKLLEIKDAGDYSELGGIKPADLFEVFGANQNLYTIFTKQLEELKKKYKKIYESFFAKSPENSKVLKEKKSMLQTINVFVKASGMGENGKQEELTSAIVDLVDESSQLASFGPEQYAKELKDLANGIIPEENPSEQQADGTINLNKPINKTQLLSAMKTHMASDDSKSGILNSKIYSFLKMTKDYFVKAKNLQEFNQTVNNQLKTLERTISQKTKKNTKKPQN